MAIIRRVIPVNPRPSTRFEIVAHGEGYLIHVVDAIAGLKYLIKTEDKEWKKMMNWKDDQWLNWINKNTPPGSAEQ